MKIVILLLAVVIGLVSSETCGSVDHCHDEVCSGTQIPTCDSHVCTCIDRPTGAIGDCNQVNDCAAYFNIHSCRTSDRHCFDMKCRCFRL